MSSIARWLIPFLLLLAPASADEPSPRIGTKIGDVTLTDVHGREHALAELAKGRATVLAFLGTGCPLAKLYAPRLADLAHEYESRGVVFVGVSPNRQDALTDLANFARVHDFPFQLLKDRERELADAVGASRVPQVFVLDGQRVVRYAGRIDDQYGYQDGVAYARPEPQRRELADALDALLAGKAVEVERTEAVGCLIGRTEPVDGLVTVTYSDHIAQIFANRCVECHREGEIAPFALTSYDEAVGWADMIAEVVGDGRMPPWHAAPEHGTFANDRRLSDEERELIFAWVRQGAPEGDPATLPEPRKFTSGWQIPEPDLVVWMSDEPYQVPAEGAVAYQYFVAETALTEDKWLAALEVRPGNRAVVHHILVFLGRNRDFGGLRGYFAAMVPGSGGEVFPPGMAKRLPAGSRLVFQVHYTPNGTPQQDRSSIGMVFADADEVEQEVRSIAAANPLFFIPPHAPDYRVESFHRFGRDAELVNFFPHMHLRGKSFRYTLEYPDGRREILLDVPRYDFNWQHTYKLAEPKPVPRGSKLHCEARYDNSADNLANPDPGATVSFGEQTWDEMMIGYFTTTESAPQRRPARRRN